MSQNVKSMGIVFVTFASCSYMPDGHAFGRIGVGSWF